MKKPQILILIGIIVSVLLIGFVIWWCFIASNKVISGYVVKDYTNVITNVDTLRLTENPLQNVSDSLSKNVKDQYIIKSKQVGLLKLGNPIKKSLNELNKDLKVSVIKIGPESSDNLYIIKENDKVLFSLIENPKGEINDIFIFDSRYRTEEGISVGMNFNKLFSTFKKYDMRFGDAQDGVTNIGSAEMLKGNGKLFLHYVDEDSPDMFASYNYNDYTFKLKTPAPNGKIGSILISLSIW